jgi:hypothetical protein
MRTITLSEIAMIAIALGIWVAVIWGIDLA